MNWYVTWHACETCGSIVTPVEAELTNEVLFQHATEWASALRAAFFQGKPPFTAPGKGVHEKNVKKSAANKKESVVKSNAPYSVKHFVRKQVLWLIQAHKVRGTCRVDYSEMTVGDLRRLMPDSSNSLSTVGLSQKVTVFDVAEGMDPLAIATFWCFVFACGKEAAPHVGHHEPSQSRVGHESHRGVQYKSSAGVPPPPSWLAKELAEGQTKKTPAGGHQPEDHQTPMVEGVMEKAAPARALAHGETQEAPATTVKSEDAHGDCLMWHSTESPPNTKLR